MAVHEDSREDQLSWTPHTEGQQGLRGGQAEQGEVLPDATGRLHMFTMQKTNAGASSCVVLMCLIVIVMGLELMCPDNPFAPGILEQGCWGWEGLPAPGGSPEGKVGLSVG